MRELDFNELDQVSGGTDGGSGVGGAGGAGAPSGSTFDFADLDSLIAKLRR